MVRAAASPALPRTRSVGGERACTGGFARRLEAARGRRVGVAVRPDRRLGR
jgi:hypothetical protein